MPGKKKKSISARLKGRAAERTYSEDGADVTLIRRMLSLTPAQHLDVLENTARAILKLGPTPQGRRQKDKLGLVSLRRALEEKIRK